MRKTIIKLVCLLRGHTDYPARIGQGFGWKCSDCGRLEA